MSATRVAGALGLCRALILNHALKGFSAVLLTLGMTAFSHAATFTLTGGSSGGNPGGQPLWEVSGLLEDDAFNVSWGGVSGLVVEGMVFIDSLTATDAEIRVMIDNLSTPISGNDPRVTAFGLDVTGLSSFSNTTGGTYLDSASNAGTFAGFNGLTNICGTSGNNCAGGGNGGIPASLMDLFTFDVSGNFGSALTLTNFALKIQGGPSGNSFELAGVPTPKPDPMGDIPEPSTVVLLMGGLASLALIRRSRLT